MNNYLWNINDGKTRTNIKFNSLIFSLQYKDKNNKVYGSKIKLFNLKNNIKVIITSLEVFSLLWLILVLNDNQY